jgi:hypothetical protein
MSGVSLEEAAFPKVTGQEDLSFLYMQFGKSHHRETGNK